MVGVISRNGQGKGTDVLQRNGQGKGTDVLQRNGGSQGRPMNQEKFSDLRQLLLDSDQEKDHDGSTSESSYELENPYFNNSISEDEVSYYPCLFSSMDNRWIQLI